MDQIIRQTENKKKQERLHKGLFYVDSSLALISIISSLFSISNDCSVSFFLFYSIYFISQSIQHFLYFTMPNIDVIKYDLTIERLVKICGFIEIFYFFLAFMFWTGSEMNPLYCFYCQKMGLSLVIGIFLDVHFIGTLFFFINVLYRYITRKYYLLALGGYQVQQRIIEERERRLNLLNILEPYFNQQLIDNPSDEKKHYHFDDIKEQNQEQQICSICLNKNKEGAVAIYTQCKHYFHRDCIEKWAKINSNCPECRSKFTEIERESEKEPEKKSNSTNQNNVDELQRQFQ